MSTLKDLARIMAERNDMQRTESEQFVVAMFDMLKDALAEEGQVKIKGLGTFKIQTMKERASVNINTGEKVIIDSHERVTFTPDASMRDSVNKPFAHFDTVLLNEGVFFDDIDAENEKALSEPVAQEEEKAVAEIASAIEETPSEVVIEEHVPDTDIPQDIHDAFMTIHKGSEETKKTEETAETAETYEMTGTTGTDGTAETTETTETDEMTGTTGTDGTAETAETAETTETAEMTGTTGTDGTAETTETDEMTGTTGTDGTAVTAETEFMEETDAADVSGDEPVIVDSETNNQNNIEEPMENLDPSKTNDYTTATIVCVVLCVLSLFVGFVIGRATSDVMWEDVKAYFVKDEKPVKVKVVYKRLPLPGDTASVSVKEQPCKAAENKKAVIEKQKEMKSETQSSPVATKAAEQKTSASKPATQEKKAVAAKPAEPKPAVSNYDKDPRVRTGAYSIVGVQQTVTVTKGQTLASISKAYLGPGMECYVEALNGVKEVKEGQKIKIPELRLKKKK